MSAEAMPTEPVGNTLVAELDEDSDDSIASMATQLVPSRIDQVPPKSGSIPMPYLAAQAPDAAPMAAPGAMPSEGIPLISLPPLASMHSMPTESGLLPQSIASLGSLPSLPPPATGPPVATSEFAQDILANAIPTLSQPITQAAPGALPVAEYYCIGTDTSDGATVHMTAPSTAEALGWNMIGSQAGLDAMQAFLGNPDAVPEDGAQAQLHRETPFPWPAPPRGS